MQKESKGTTPPTSERSSRIVGEVDRNQEDPEGKEHGGPYSWSKKGRPQGPTGEIGFSLSCDCLQLPFLFYF